MGKLVQKSPGILFAIAKFLEENRRSPLNRARLMHFCAVLQVARQNAKVATDESPTTYEFCTATFDASMVQKSPVQHVASRPFSRDAPAGALCYQPSQMEICANQ